MDEPIGTKTQKALRWVAQEMHIRPGVKRWQLVTEAATRFDLSPKEAELLLTKKSVDSGQGEEG
jgi:hypothetical protein